MLHSVVVSGNTVLRLVTAIKGCGKTSEELAQLDDDAWNAALSDPNHTPSRKENPDWAYIHQEMLRPEATREQLWREWREEHPAGIGYSRFTAEYRKWLGAQKLIMRQIHRPGDKVFTDFAGQTVEIRSQSGEPSRHAQLFVAVMGCSNLAYLEAVWQQTAECWVSAQTNALEFFGGVPNWIVNDNLKAAVTRRERDRITINPAYADFLKHYGLASLPTKPKSPRQNAKAEAGVQIAQRWVLFALRNRVFFSFEEANKEIRRLNLELNERPFKKMPGCRRTRFEELDKPALRPLADIRYEYANWRYAVRVGDDYLVEHQKSFYSVPWKYRGDSVDIRFNQRMIEVFRKNVRIAVHPINNEIGGLSRREEHMPAAHRSVLEGEPLALIKWAKSAGQHVEKMITYHLTERHDPTNGLRAARKMRELSKLYGEDRFEAVCHYALTLNITALRSVESIIKSGADLRAHHIGVLNQTSNRTAHSDVRGPNYFGE
jgi:transposase